MSPRAAWRLEALGFGEVYDYGAGKADWLAFGLPTEGSHSALPTAASVARTDAPTSRPTEPVEAARARAREAGVEVSVVVNDAGVVVGILRQKELAAPDGTAVDAAMRPGPSTFRPHVAIEEMAEYMSKHDLPNAPITRSDGTLLGVLFREDAERLAAKDRRRGEGGR